MRYINNTFPSGYPISSCPPSLRSETLNVKETINELYRWICNSRSQ